MAKTRKGRLPKDFEALLQAGDIDALKRVFETHDVNARGGYSKQTALAYSDCPNELARWLVEQGADILAENSYGETPLHSRAGHWRGIVEILIELGADVHRGEGRIGTPLHRTMGPYNVDTARVLLFHGARVDALNKDGETPLAYGLKRCANAQISSMATVAEHLLSAGAEKTPEMQVHVTRIGTEFEWTREKFNPDHLDETSAALDRLYTMFDVTPVPRHIRHDGKSPIRITSMGWQDQHQELWQLLVPASGAAATIQGEVVRISGRIHDEMMGSGGVNWDTNYSKMADDFLAHVGGGVPLPDTLLAEAKTLVSAVKRRKGDTSQLCRLAVRWVELNTQPVKLTPPDYDR